MTPISIQWPIGTSCVTIGDNWYRELDGSVVADYRRDDPMGDQLKECLEHMGLFKQAKEAERRAEDE